MNSKSKKVRLSAQTSFGDLEEIFSSILAGYEYVDFKPRTSQKEGDWKQVVNPKGHAWNLEKFNYRIGSEPRITIEGDEVQAEDGYISKDEAKSIVGLARRAKRDKKQYTSRAGGDDPVSLEYDVIITRSGNATVGCSEFTFKEIEDFAQSQGW